MNRRSFLGTNLAAAVAPAIVRADSLMRIVPRDTLFMDADLLLPDMGPFIGRVVAAQIVSFAGIIEEKTSVDVFRGINGNVCGNRRLIVKPAAPSPSTFSDKERREHAALRAKWAVGRATKAQILRCIELDRRANWVEARLQERRAARAKVGK